MSTGNPLIARANSSVDPWAGVWIAEDIETIYRGVKGGSWIEGTFVFEGKLYKVAVTVGSNGFIVGANPVGH